MSDQKMTCECGKNILKKRYMDHLLTDLHKRWMNPKPKIRPRVNCECGASILKCFIEKHRTLHIHHDRLNPKPKPEPKPKPKPKPKPSKIRKRNKAFIKYLTKDKVNTLNKCLLQKLLATNIFN